jgi:hypothetical protein
MTDVYTRLAENDGARFQIASESYRWTAKDRDGIAIVSDAMSVAEAARLYCEDRGLTSPGEILDRIATAYRPFHILAEFWEGFRACRRDGVFRCNPYRDDEGIKAQTWDRGAEVAMHYQRAVARIATTPADDDQTEPGWLLKLLRTGRR